MVEGVYFELLVTLSEEIVEPFLVPKLLPRMAQMLNARTQSKRTNDTVFRSRLTDLRCSDSNDRSDCCP